MFHNWKVVSVRITGRKKVIYFDNNNKSLERVGFIRNTVINRNVYECYITPLVIYLHLL